MICVKISANCLSYILLLLKQTSFTSLNMYFIVKTTYVLESGRTLVFIRANKSGRRMSCAAASSFFGLVS